MEIMANQVPIGNLLPGLDEAPYEAICPASDRFAWLTERQKGIGSSDAAAILGIYPWRTPLEVYAEKIGLGDEDGAGEAAYWGTQIEPLVLRRFAEATGRNVLSAGMLLRSKAEPWQLSTLDGVQTQDGREGPGSVEIKCTGLVERWDDGVPPYVIAQVQHQFAVTGYTWGSVAVLFNGREFFWKDFERDDAMIEAMRELERDFYRRVLELDPPSPGGTEAERQAIARLFPADVDPAPVVLDGSFIDQDERRGFLKEEIKRHEEEVRQIENQLRMAIADHVEALLPSGVRYTNKLQSRKECVMPATSFRVLRRSERKGK